MTIAHDTAAALGDTLDKLAEAVDVECPGALHLAIQAREQLDALTAALPSHRSAVLTAVPADGRPGMRIYLAARYSRRLELCGYRDALARLGITVTSRWLNGSHQLDNYGVPIGDDGERRFEMGDPAVGHLRTRFADDDLADVLAADMLVAFTEEPRTTSTRGGRHVELGLALGTGKRIAVIGPRENVFCWLPQVEHHPAWPDFLATLTEAAEIPDWWTTGDVAAYLQVAPSTVRAYLARRQMPPPDRFIGHVRVWCPQTIRAWHQSRPRRPALTALAGTR